ncbi:hypothetical protein [Clostridium polynesiense]|uniref:hypothetical protein n=1 Tax=Clostridium polynesiense TaxID=1325933 RepID=UPI0005909975|nr:hypothetical protein [Clostridium polynesiense]
MKRKNSIGILIVIILTMIGVWGCSMDNKPLSKDNTDSGITLNERQKEILSKNDLPTEYNKLNSSQKDAIVAIEEMLQAVEKKYGMEFAYSGYIAENVLEKEQLRAYPASGDKATDSFTVTRIERNGEIVYKDDYINHAVSHLFSSYIEGFVKKEMKIDAVKVFSEITATSLEAVPEDFSKFHGSVESNNSLFIDSKELSEDQLSSFINKYEKWMKEHQLFGSTQIILLKPDILIRLTKYNFTDYLFEKYYLRREFSYLNK